MTEEPIRQHHDAFAIAGLTLRTSNHRNFGVYSNYESDAHGAFDVTARVAVSQGGTVPVPAGDYLVFTGHGEMPQGVLDVWQRIWAWFDAQPEAMRKRSGEGTIATPSPREVEDAKLV